MTINPITLYDRWVESRLSAGERSLLASVRSVIRNSKVTYRDSSRVVFGRMAAQRFVSETEPGGVPLVVPGVYEALGFNFGGFTRVSCASGSYTFKNAENDQTASAVATLIALEALDDQWCDILSPRITRLVINEINEAFDRHEDWINTRFRIGGCVAVQRLESVV